MKFDSLVLFSGGIDSAVCLEQEARHGAFHQRYGSVLALVFDYGQPHRIEVEYAKAFTAARSIECKVLKITLAESGILDPEDDSPVVPGRNLVFLSYALSIAKISNIGRVVIGSTLEDQELFYDCRAEFIASFNRLSILLDGPRVSAPLINMRKTDVLRLAEDLGINIDDTWSCYFPSARGNDPCGKCLACKVRKGAENERK